ncbi:hypothetical protein WA158_007857 [Blastocystis sp. Blastoise]
MNPDLKCAVTKLDIGLSVKKERHNIQVTDDALFVKTNDATIIKFNKETFEKICSYSSTGVNILKWCIAKNFMATWGNDLTIRIWDEMGNMVNKIDNTASTVNSICFSYDASKLLISMPNRLIGLSPLNGSMLYARDLPFTPSYLTSSKTKFYIAGTSGIIYVVNPADGNLLVSYDPMVPSDWTANSLPTPELTNSELSSSDPYATTKINISEVKKQLVESIPSNKNCETNDILDMIRCGSTRYILNTSQGLFEILDTKKSTRTIMYKDINASCICSLEKKVILGFNNGDIILYDSHMSTFTEAYRDESEIIGIDADHQYFYYATFNGHLKKTSIETYQPGYNDKYMSKGPSKYYIPYVNITVPAPITNDINQLFHGESQIIPVQHVESKQATETPNSSLRQSTFRPPTTSLGYQTLTKKNAMNTLKNSNDNSTLPSSSISEMKNPSNSHPVFKLNTNNTIISTNDTNNTLLETKKTISSSSSDTTISTETIPQLKQTIKELEQSVFDINKLYSEEKKKNDEQFKEIQLLKDKKDTDTNSSSIQSKDVDQSSKKQKESDDTIKALKTINQQLKKDLEKSQIILGKVSDENERLYKENNIMKKDYDSIVQQLKSLSSSKDSTQSLLNSSDNNKTIQKDSIATIQSQYEKQIAILNYSVVQIQKQYDTMKDRLMNLLKNLKYEIPNPTTSEDPMDHFEEILNTYTEQITVLMEDNDKLEEQMKEYQNKNSSPMIKELPVSTVKENSMSLIANTENNKNSMKSSAITNPSRRASTILSMSIQNQSIHDCTDVETLQKELKLITEELSRYKKDNANLNLQISKIVELASQNEESATTTKQLYSETQKKYEELKKQYDSIVNSKTNTLSPSSPSGLSTSSIPTTVSVCKNLLEKCGVNEEQVMRNEQVNRSMNILMDKNMSLEEMNKKLIEENKQMKDSIQLKNSTTNNNSNTPKNSISPKDIDVNQICINYQNLIRETQQLFEEKEKDTEYCRQSIEQYTRDKTRILEYIEENVKLMQTNQEKFFNDILAKIQADNKIRENQYKTLVQNTNNTSNSIVTLDSVKNINTAYVCYCSYMNSQYDIFKQLLNLIKTPSLLLPIKENTLEMAIKQNEEVYISNYKAIQYQSQFKELLTAVQSNNSKRIQDIISRTPLVTPLAINTKHFEQQISDLTNVVKTLNTEQQQLLIRFDQEVQSLMAVLDTCLSVVESYIQNNNSIQDKHQSSSLSQERIKAINELNKKKQEYDILKKSFTNEINRLKPMSK